MKLFYLIAIICAYRVYAFMHPEVLMTESMQFKPKTNSSQWNPMLSSVTSNCTVESGTAEIITYVEKGWLKIQSQTYTAPTSFDSKDIPNMQYTTTISKDGKISNYNNGTETVNIKCDVHLLSEDDEDFEA